MSYGQSRLYTILSDSTVTDLLTDGASGIWYDTVLPVSVKNKDSVILYYRPVPVDRGLDYLESNYSVNCYAATMAEAEAIADAAMLVINRNYSGGYNFRVSVSPVIPQPTPTDGYNAPLDVKIWGKTFN